jgi:hypothetical protein
VWDAGGGRFGACGSLFTTDGRFVAPLASGLRALVGGLAVVDDYSEGGLRLVAPGDDPDHAPRLSSGWADVVTTSPDGARVLLTAVHDGGRRLQWWDVGTREALADVALAGHGATLALAELGPERALWYGERSCRTVACRDGAPRCTESLCDRAAAYELSTDGTLTDSSLLPAGLRAVALDRTGTWLAAVDEAGVTTVRSVADPHEVTTLSPSAKVVPGAPLTLALADDASFVARADAESLAVWRRDRGGFATAVHEPASFNALTWAPTGDDLLAFDTFGVHAYHPGAVSPSPLPTFDVPAPRGFTRVPDVDGRPTVAESGRGDPWVADLDVIAWYRDAPHGEDIEVTAWDRAEFDPDLDATAWAHQVLHRLGLVTILGDALSGPGVDSAVWTRDDGRRILDLHYTTTDGCEQYELAFRAYEQGEHLVVIKLRMFAGEPWDEVWRQLTDALGEPIPDEARTIAGQARR